MRPLMTLLLACTLAACAPAAAQSPWSNAALDDLEMVAENVPLEVDGPVEHISAVRASLERWR